MIQSVADARATYIRARNGIALLDRTLSGCDWCCGGGSARRSADSAIFAEAVRYLLDHGAELPADLCEECTFYDAEVAHTDAAGRTRQLCQKCAAVLAVLAVQPHTG